MISKYIENSIVGKKVNIAEINSHAAGMSYYLLLSLFPFLIFMINIIGYIPVIHINKFTGMFIKVIPDTAFLAIQSILNSAIQNRSIGLTIFSFILTMWTSSRAVRLFVKAINKSYSIKETRSFFKLTFMSFFFTFEIIVLIVVSMVLLVYGENIGYIIFDFIGLDNIFIPVWDFLRYAISILSTVIILSSLFCFSPNKNVKIIEAMPGALTSIVGWLFASFTFSFYTNNYANYQVIYGSIGGIIALMTWLYISSWIMLMSCEVNSILYYRIIKRNLL